MAADKVTLRFESTIETPNSEPLLLSGPIQLFGTVDLFEELFNADMKAAINDESAQEYNRIVVFVSDVADVEAQTHRGAYFLYVGSRPIEKDNLDISDWREILLGTHSHSNMAGLESLEGLAPEKEQIVVAKPDGTFSVVDPKELLADNGALPPLPADIQSQIDYLKKYKDLLEPTSSETNHLDAPLEELANAYDWLEKDVDGNYRNLPVGSCRDLYRRLLKADRKLYLKDDYSLAVINGRAYFEASAYEINFDDREVFKLNGDTYEFEVTLPWNILEQDIVLLFNNDNKLLEPLKITVNGRTAKVFFDANDSELIERLHGNQKITLLVLKDAENVDSSVLKQKFESGELNLGDINEALVKLYIEGELNRKPNVPKLYLTTDEYGTIGWDNKLLPAQYFYSNSIVVDSEYLEKPENIVGNNIQLVFKDARYDRKNGDFALLLADNVFAFDILPDETNLVDAVYLVPKDSRYLDEDGTIFNLIVIKKTSADAIADQIAENYISKKDAVDILSHGKINLKDYAKMSDLIALSKVGHTHSQYALKGHDHDYRYANFYHTHPELLKAVASIIGGDSEEIQTKLEELSKEEQLVYKNLIESLFRNAGFTIERDETGEISSAKITDGNVTLASETIDTINSILDASATGKDLKLESAATVSDALRVISEMFERDTVLTSQVLLNSDITVKLKNGPIGGIDSERTYTAGTSLESILKDMLNPYKSVDEIVKILKPVDVKLKWFKYNTYGEIVEIDPAHIPYGDNGGKLLFKYQLINEYGNECKFKIVRDGKELILKTTATVLPLQSLDIDGSKYVIYDDNFDFTQTKDKYEPIEFIFQTIRVYDNYGLNGKDVDFDKLEITPKFEIEFVDYFVGNLENLKEEFTKEDIFELRKANASGIYKFMDIKLKPFIVVFAEDKVIDNITIVDVLSGYNIKGFFKELDNAGGIECFTEKKYYGFVYEVYNKSINDLTLKIN